MYLVPAEPTVLGQFGLCVPGCGLWPCFMLRSKYGCNMTHSLSWLRIRTSNLWHKAPRWNVFKNIYWKVLFPFNDHASLVEMCGCTAHDSLATRGTHTHTHTPSELVQVTSVRFKSESQPSFCLIHWGLLAHRTVTILLTKRHLFECKSDIVLLNVLPF